jgi:hydrogenase maturation protein HypF
MTSSAGRCFDAVAAMLGVRQEVDYEGQAAIELEMLAPDSYNDSEVEPYPFSIDTQSGINIIKLGEVYAEIVRDIRNRAATPLISLRFHHTMEKIITGTCKIIREQTGTDHVALSGGVFQNRLLLKLARAGLMKEGFRVLTHRLVPCNDGGVSLGQAVVANYKIKK